MPGKSQNDPRIIMCSDNMRHTTVYGCGAELVRPMAMNNITTRLPDRITQLPTLAAKEVQHLPSWPAYRADIGLNAIPPNEVCLGNTWRERKEHNVMASLMQPFRKCMN